MKKIYNKILESRVVSSSLEYVKKRACFRNLLMHDMKALPFI